MSTITFEQVTLVYVDGKLVGDIRLVAGGYQYRVKGRRKYVGEVYPTIDLCKRSLLGD